MSFEKNVQTYLDRLSERLEASGLDTDYANLTLSFPVACGLYLFKVHGLTEEIWLSSPVSGGHRFAQNGDQWINIRTEEELDSFLQEELGIFF